MKKILYSFLILAAVLAFAAGPRVASAIPITSGSNINFTMDALPADSTLSPTSDFSIAAGTVGIKFAAGPANAFVSFLHTGDYGVGFADFSTTDTATFTDFLFSPLTPTPVSLWTATSSNTGDIATFILRSVTISTQSDNELVLNGTGTLTLTGFDSTPGTFNLTAGLTGVGAFNFSASNTAVPEPGTIALLGIGLAGLVGVGVRRRAKKNAA